MIGKNCAAGRGAIATIAVIAVTIALAPSAHADADSVATLGLGTRVAYQNAGDRGVSTSDYTTHFGVRAKALYILGLEVEYAPIPTSQRGDLFRPSKRLTGHLHIVNSDRVGAWLGFGTAADSFGGLFDLDGDRTLYRLGGGAEWIFSKHWALGLDAYWTPPSVGAYLTSVEDAAPDEASVAAAARAGDPIDTSIPRYDASHFEVGGSVRVYF
jgi:hypothetical protein